LTGQIPFYVDVYIVENEESALEYGFIDRN